MRSNRTTRVVAELPSVEAEPAEADPGGERVDEEKVGVPARDLEPELAFAVVPVQREEPVQPLHVLRLRGDGREGGALARGRGRGREAGGSGAGRAGSAR